MVEHPASVVIVGAGGHARVVAEAMSSSHVVGYIAPLETRSASAFLGPWLGDDSNAARLSSEGHHFALGVGFVDREGATHREAILASLANAELATVQHSTAIVSPSAIIAAGTFIGAGAIVGSGVEIGRGAIINTGAIIDHDCRIGVNVHIAPGSVLSGGVMIGDHTLVGVGSSVLQGIRVGDHVVVGAAACVTRDQLDDVTVVGVPALPISGQSGTGHA